jgi:hypothetical protein
MAAQSTHNGDLVVTGTLIPKTLNLPSGCVKADDIEAGAGIEATKLEHRYRPDLSQAYGSAGTSERRVVHQVIGATGKINSVRAQLELAPVGAATHSIQVKKNGTNILSSALVLDSTNANHIDEIAAGFTAGGDDLVTGDVIAIDVTATAGGGTLGQGLHVMLDLDEDAS